MGQLRSAKHRLRKRHFRRPVACFVCSQLIYGKGIQGYRCSECSVSVHVECASQPFLESTCTLGSVHTTGISKILKSHVRSLKDSISKDKDKEKKAKAKKKKRRKSKDLKAKTMNATLPCTLGAMKEEAPRASDKKVQTLPYDMGADIPAATDKTSVVCLGWQSGRLHIADDRHDDKDESQRDGAVRGRQRKKSCQLQREPRIELPVMLEQASPRLPSGASFSVVMTKQQHSYISTIQQVNALRQSSSLYKSMASLDGSSTSVAAGSDSSVDDVTRGDAPTPFVMSNADGSTQLMLFTSSMDIPLAIPIEEEPDAKAIQRAIGELKNMSFAQMSQREISQTISDLGLPALSRPMRIDVAPSLAQLQSLVPTSLDLHRLSRAADSANCASLPSPDALEMEACEKKNVETLKERLEREQKEQEKAAVEAMLEETLEMALTRAKEMLAWTDQALSNQNPAHVAKFLSALAERANLIHKKWCGEEGVHDVLKSAKARLEEGQEFVGFMQAENTTWMEDLSCEEESYSGSEFSFEEDDAAELGGFTL